MPDRGAIFAGWVGLGMAVVIAISFELVVAIQSIVFMLAPVTGVLIGFYANARSERRRPWWRLFVNAAYAGLVTGLSLALLYGGIRLLFVYADNGYRDPGLGGQIICTTGPSCTYERYLDAGRGDELTRLGVSDAQTFERYVLAEQLNGALTLFGLTTGGALVGGALYGLAGRSNGSRPAYAT
ncbi:MAG: hypothetical protein H0X16_00330 [Chloroflexi bacterium]|nr:hypothetical protein [Chloroflexota bacterium]